MSLRGRMAIHGDVESEEDLIVEGRVTGHIWNVDHTVTIGTDAIVTGDIVARMISVRGAVDGMMLATGLVHVGHEARVTGRVLARQFMLAEGATFNGKVEPQHLDAALRVARHRHRGAADEAAKPAVAPAR